MMVKLKYMIWALIFVLGVLCCPSNTQAQFPTYYGYYNNYRSPGEQLVLEVADHVNINMAVSYAGDTPELLSQIVAANSQNIKSIVAVDYLFFDRSRGLDNAPILPDSIQRWADFVNTLSQNGLLQNVAAFDVFDEPDHNHISSSSINYVVSVMKSNPLTASIPTFATFNNYGTSVRNYNLDWVGLDDYANDIFGGGYFSRYQIFKRNADLSRQKLVLVPQAAYGGGGLDNSPDDIYNFYNNVNGDSAVVAILPFVWWSNPSVGSIGLQTNPNLRLPYTEVGKMISGKYILPPPVLSVISDYCKAYNEIFWTPVAGATRYELYSTSLNNSGNGRLIYSGTQTNLGDFNLATVGIGGSTYLTVRACNDSGCSGSSFLKRAMYYNICR